RVGRAGGARRELPGRCLEPVRCRDPPGSNGGRRGLEPGGRASGGPRSRSRRDGVSRRQRRRRPGDEPSPLSAALAARLAPGPHVPVSRERWELSDGDFVDVDRMAGPRDAPLLVALHGLEGSSSAHYVRGLLAQARMRGWRALALNFRGCSGDMNRLVRSYHSGETGDLSELVRRAQDESDRIVLAGFSLGGNVLVKWLGELGDSAPREIRAAVALS